MRKTYVFILLLAFSLLLMGCSKGKKDQYSFKAKILEINEDSILVEPFEGEDIRSSSDKISFSKEKLEDIDLSVGDKVEVKYTGRVMESYPAQITATSWKLLED